ncbi:protein of unknown function [Oceanospirillum multiglobuliferum]|uniref:DUF4892 domain-containing protein n=1 Tax=Oceanospirillum multiglobuliferum TaxID=64969 RepID=A0A1T4N1D9_9GAMM|nr:DUF4892 domain-containing protein [Oceanospirillum multiglobuliferum]OPX55806.1 hypothetical protein BTE48_06270 [Oceanospirillum multiglobuliferum]SJZ73190.1 protein of unknown function [Oceanospirillum multiglobuliferum]
MSNFLPRPTSANVDLFATIMDKIILSYVQKLFSKPLKALFILVLLTNTAGVYANNWLEPFPLSRLENSQQSEQPQYLVAVGRIQNKSGVSAPEHWLQLPKGMLEKATYRVESSKDTNKIFQHYRSQIQQSGEEIVFECSSRDCGSSIDWANKVFKLSTLYGVDRKQHYIVAQRQQGDNSEYVIVYITERGTGRIYVHTETYQFKTSALPSSALSDAMETDLYQQLNQYGWISLPVTPHGRYEDLDAEKLRLLVSQLNQDQYQYWLVAHHYGKGSDQALQALSEQAAQGLLQQLNAMGLTAGKAQAKGLGALAPTKDSVVYGGRLELVRQKIR